LQLWCVVRSPLIAAVSAVCVAGCYAVEFPDGTIACGEAGCPDGMSCALDGLCYSDPPDPDEPGGAVKNRVLATANYVAPDRVYAMCDGELDSVWSSGDAYGTTSVAWGDLDRNGDPELVFGRYEAGVVAYDVTGAFVPLWSTGEPWRTQSIALADFDEDGDDDLVLGADNDAVRVFRWIFADERFDSAWSSPMALRATSVAWADLDGDGDLDMGVGVFGQSNGMWYDRREGFDDEWLSTADNTLDAAWADYDGDGDADLVAGNFGQANVVYRNDHDHDHGGGGGGGGGGWDDGWTLVWDGGVPSWTTSVAWGDYDGDGDLDFAVGNRNEPNEVFRNDGDDSFSLVWTSDEVDSTEAIAWGDYDGDGDLDLAVGNNGRNRVYRNDGGGAFALDWTSPESEETRAIAWAEWSPGIGDPTVCAVR
jgi:hypothetical protein